MITVLSFDEYNQMYNSLRLQNKKNNQILIHDNT